MGISGYRELRVWQSSMGLAEQVYRLTQQHFPKQEMYGLSSQMQRAAVSIPSNIAEGYARDSTPDYLRFISISLGSLAELETQLLLARNLAYTNSQDLDVLLLQTDEIRKMLRGLQKALKAKL